MRRILLITKDSSLRTNLEEQYSENGLDWIESEKLPEETDLSASQGIEAIVIDGSGLSEEKCSEILEQAKRVHAASPIVLLTPEDSAVMAVKALRGGAFDVVERQADNRLLAERISRAVVEYEHRRVSSAFDQDFRILLENVPDIVFALDNRRQFRVVSKSVVNVLGYQPSELLGKSPVDFMPEEDRAEAIKRFENVETEGVPDISSVDIRLVTKEGQIRCFEVHRRIRIKDGKVFTIEGVARDITERKRLESELAEHSEQLEKKVQERTERVERASRQLSALNRVSIELTKFKEEKDLFEAAPRLMTQSLDFDRSMLFTITDAGCFSIRGVSMPHDTPELVQKFLDRAGRGEVRALPHAVDCIRERRTIFVADLANDPRWSREAGHPVRTKSIVMTPLTAGDEVIAIISGNMQHHERKMDEQDIERIETFANMVGLAVENIRAHKYLEEKVVDRTRSLLSSKVELEHKNARLDELLSKIRRSSEELQAILDTSLGSIVMVNRDGVITARNNKVRRMFGLVEDPIRGIRFEDFKDRIETCFENKASFRSLLAELEERSAAVYENSRCIHEQDPQLVYAKSQKITFPEPMDIAVYSERVCDGNGLEIGRVWIFLDISEAKRADQELRTIVDASPVPLIVSRIDDGTILYANQPLADAIGISLADLTGRKTPDFYANPAERDEVRRLMTTEGRIQHREVQIRRQDGTTIWTLFNLESSTLLGEPVIIGGLYDISERKRVEEQLARRLRYEEALATAMQALLTGEDTDDTLNQVLESLRVASNTCSVYIFERFEEDGKVFCRMTNEAVDPTSPRRGMDYPFYQRMPVTDDPDWQRLREGIPYSQSIDEVPPESRKDLEIAGMKSMLNLPIFIESEWYGFMGFVDIVEARIWTDEDIQLLKTAAEMIGVYFYKKRVLQDLQTANRKIRETQSQLVQSEKMAALGMLVAGVAHEINTPVGALISMHDTQVRAVERLKKVIAETEACQTEQIAGVLQVINEANQVISNGAKRVTTIVRRLRSFARLDEAERMKIDIHEGIEDTLMLIHHEIKRSIKVNRNFGEIPEIVCYPGQLNQVYLNLFVNAKQAMTEGGELTVATSMDSGRVRIDISDTGKGIPPEHLSKIFDPGFTTKGVGVGTGLGLSIVYKIILAHRGKITVASEVGKGTTFTILLPVENEDETNSDQQEAS